MTRYPVEHKANTRERLLEAARSAFREEGFDTFSIDRLMQSAGLTRGAFYAHFESKEALIREVLRIESGLVRNLGRLEAGPAGRREAVALFDDYLDPKKRDDLIQCPMVAHPLDALRGGDTRQHLYEKHIQDLIGAVESVLDDAKDASDRATLTAVVAVGAAILSSVSTPKNADHIQEVARKHIAELIKKRSRRKR